MLMTILSGIVGVTLFFGLWKNLGKIHGKFLAIKQKSLQKKTIDLLKDEKVKQLAIEKMKQANIYLVSEAGERRKNWVVNIIINTIPGDLDNKIVEQYVQGLYEEYKEEIRK